VVVNSQRKWPPHIQPHVSASRPSCLHTPMQGEDLRKLHSAGCAAVFMPPALYITGSSAVSSGSGGTAGGSGSAAGASNASMVVGASDEEFADPGAHETWVSVERLSQGLCARSRPHFFRGVCTVRGLQGGI
jgi:pantoate--beta-alanine ligase